VHDDDPLRLGPPGFLNEPVHVVGITAQQDDRTFQVEGGGSDDSIDGAPMTREACYHRW
jgi:hypothetical protein